MPHRPHILFVGHLAQARWFGAERSFLDLLQAVDRTRYRVSCILPRDEPAYSARVREHAEDLTFVKNAWWGRKPAVDEALVERYTGLLRDGQVDLVHVNTIMVREPLVAAKRMGIPGIVHVRELIAHDDVLVRLIGASADEIIRSVQDNATFIVANSSATQQMYGALDRSCLLYDTVDVESLAIPNDANAATLRVGMVSDNQPKKGGDNVVNLAVFASGQRSDVEFLLIGPRTPYIDSLEAAVLAEPSPVNMRFVDYCPEPTRALAQLDVLLSLSDVHESFGRTALEAMAAGRPVIAHATGALPELIRDGIDGFLVPPADLETVWQHIQTFADRRELARAMGEQGRQRAQAFSRAAFVDRLASIYANVLAS